MAERKKPRLTDSPGAGVEKTTDVQKLIDAMGEGGGPTKRLNAQVDAALHARFKGRVAENGRTMKEVLESLMNEYLSK